MKSLPKLQAGKYLSNTQNLRNMGDESVLWGKTKDLFDKVGLKAPKLTEKLLLKPPFRCSVWSSAYYLHTHDACNFAFVSSFLSSLLAELTNGVEFPSVVQFLLLLSYPELI